MRIIDTCSVGFIRITSKCIKRDKYFLYLEQNANIFHFNLSLANQDLVALSANVA